MNDIQREIWNLLDERQPLNHNALWAGLPGVDIIAMCHEIEALKQDGLIMWKDPGGFRFTTKEEELEKLGLPPNAIFLNAAF